MTYVQECLEKFQELPANAKEKIGGAEAFNFIKKLENEYNISLSFLVILLAISELSSNDIYDYLITKYQLKPITAKVLSQEIDTKILDPFFEELLNENEIISIKPAQEKEILLKIFSDRLVETLKINKSDDLNKLNIFIFKALQSDDLIEDKIISIFYNNQEKLTANHLLFEDHEVSPTISNWLKDFIKKNGSELFNEISLEQYLINSINAKKLNVEEKELVRKLLKLYRNLVFFPESMDGVPLEKWEIFPVEHEEDVQHFGKVKDVLDDDFNNKSQDLKTKDISTRPASDSSLNSQIFELEKNLGKYSPASLEYKVIIQEITRLKQKNK